MKYCFFERPIHKQKLNNYSAHVKLVSSISQFEVNIKYRNNKNQFSNSNEDVKDNFKFKVSKLSKLTYSFFEIPIHKQKLNNSTHKKFFSKGTREVKNRQFQNMFSNL